MSLQSQNRDDWVHNTNATGPTQDLDGYHDNAARVQLLLAPAAGLTVLGNLHARDLDGSARVFYGHAFRPGSNDFVTGFDESKVTHDGANALKIRSVGGSLRVRWDLGGVALNSITGYEQIRSKSRGDIDGTIGGNDCFFNPACAFVPGVSNQIPSETADNVTGHHQITQELRLESTGAGPVKWLGGVYYFDEKLVVDTFNYNSLAPGNPQSGPSRQQQDNQAWAVFGSLNYDVTPQLKLRGGLRYTRDTKDFVVQSIDPPGAAQTLNKTASNTSFDVSGTYVLSKDFNLYARVATGFRAPSIQGRFGVVTSADSEKVRSYEAGVKADLFDRRARATFTLFHYDVKGQQLVAVGGGSNVAKLLNAKKTTGQGFEFDLQAYVTSQLLLGASLSYNDTQIKQPGLGVAPCSGGCTVTDPIVGGFAMIDGNPLPQAPKVIANLNARQGFALGSGEAYLMGDLSYRSKVNFFLYESREFTGRPLTELGLRAGYLWGNGKYEAAAFVRNATNKIVATSTIDFTNLTAMVNEPRTFGVQFKAQF